MKTVTHILVVEDQFSRRTISLEESKYTIGRHSSNAIVLNSKHASRHHATLVKKINRETNENSFWILDGDLEGNRSHNGIYINGEKCLIHELKDGDLINFGCEVNASFHAISAQSSQGSEAILPDRQVPQHLLSDPHLRRTLVISAPPKENLSSEETFEAQAYLDPLTDLPNQILFKEHLSTALNTARRQKTLLAVIFLDLEQFKNINETLGYSVGDQVLKAIAEKLKACLRLEDIVARWEGDRFALLLPQLKNEGDIDKILPRILKALKQPLALENHSISLSGKMGIAVYPKGGEDAASLLNQAEIELKKNQQPGTPQAGYTPQIAPMTSPLSQIAAWLQQALDHQEFSLVYQPQIEIETGNIQAMEGFLRWHHPARGWIPPRQFFPWIEKTDLMLPITRWVLETACLQNQRWQQAGLSSFPVSINLSQAQFQHPQLVELLTQVLSETGLAPHWLELEMTEASILKNLDLAYKSLQQLRQIGVSCTIDDFGKGYVSIGYLQKMPIHKLKIDQSFIHKLSEDPQDTAMISVLITLAESFHLKIVAEGVETEQQLEILRSLQCKVIQGHRFTPPLSSQDATQFLSTYRAEPIR